MYYSFDERRKVHKLTFYVSVVSAIQVLETIQNGLQTLTPEQTDGSISGLDLLKMSLNRLTIEAGLPHNDYGQIVTLELGS